MIGRENLISLPSVVFLLLVVTLNGLSACTFFNEGRTLYNREGSRIGLEDDPSVSRSSQAELNNHPIDWTSKDLESILQSIQVRGYSGTIMSLMAKPQSKPLFTPKELAFISEHLARAFREAKPTERVFFSLPKPDVAYSEDRTAGAMFFRGPYLHVVVTDHSSVIRTDTGGGEYKDIRDTKGMTLWVASPAQAAMVPDLEKPRWAHFERVHISLPAKDVLARKAYLPTVHTRQDGTDSPVLPPSATSTEHPQGNSSPDELQRQLQELSGTNQELKARLDEQNKRMQQLQEQVERLRREGP
ncbi:MAG TPA: hypothetical protein PKD12_11210 [Nitrospira sp.]|nr:hypothetical protein [Nitrospira sp.]